MHATESISLDDRLQRLDDRQAISQLVTRLGRMLDEQRFGDADGILAADVTVQTPGGSAQGPEAVIAQARRNHTVRTHHAISDVLIELEGDRAQARANLIVTFAPDQPGSRLTIGDIDHPDAYLTIGEVYRFEAVRVDEGWRLARIETERVWSSRPLPERALVGQTGGDTGPAAA